MASLQLLCTVGGNQARLDARTKFEILERSSNGVEASCAPSRNRVLKLATNGPADGDEWN